MPGCAVFLKRAVQGYLLETELWTDFDLISLSSETAEIYPFHSSFY